MMAGSGGKWREMAGNYLYCWNGWTGQKQLDMGGNGLKLLEITVMAENG